MSSGTWDLAKPNVYKAIVDTKPTTTSILGKARATLWCRGIRRGLGRCALRCPGWSCLGCSNDGGDAALLRRLGLRRSARCWRGAAAWRSLGAEEGLLHRLAFAAPTMFLFPRLVLREALWVRALPRARCRSSSTGSAATIASSSPSKTCSSTSSRTRASRASLS